jgi:uncharacterized protein (UPF0335 family)
MINELNDERYVQIDALVSKEALNKFIDATENLQIELMNSNVDAKEIYQYLVTIMLNQC